MDLARPADYVKNCFVLAPLFFAGDFWHAEKLEPAMVAFCVFCLLVSGCYAINDVLDAQADRRHPLKKGRPVASGRIGPGLALTAACLWIGIGIAISAAISLDFMMVGGAYLVLQLFYSLIFKHWPICDVLAISLGFILRVIAGGLAVQVYVSTWLIVCTGLLTIFLAIGKRRCEFTVLKIPTEHRKVFQFYSPGMMDMGLIIIGMHVLATYVAYLCFSETGPKGPPPGLLLTIPLVAVGLYRLFTIFRRNCRFRGIVEIIIQDTIIKILLAVWVCLFYTALYL